MNKFYLKSRSVFILIAFLIINIGFAQQQKTAYEKKIEKITEKNFQYVTMDITNH